MKHEKDALATLIAEILQKEYQDFEVRECGIYRLNKPLDFLAISPDGVIHVGSKRITIELKCPAFKQTSDLNARAMYMLQVHAEMVAVDAEEAYLVSWGPYTSTIWHVKFDKELWTMVTEWLIKFRSLRQPPTSIPQKCKDIQERCKTIAESINHTRKIVTSWTAADTIVID